MAPTIPDYVIEPILWLIAAVLFLLLGIFFLNKYRKSEEAARAFFSGTSVFFFSYFIFRTLEVIRRYFIVDNFYDIENWWYNSGPTPAALSIYFRLAFLFISWVSIAYFYFRIESTILQKKTFYILTAASLLKLIVNPLMYYPDQFPLQIMEIVNSILFVIAGFFPVCLFAYYALRNYVEKRGSWAMLALGMLCYIIGEVGSNPEAYMITSGMNPVIINFGSPIMVILGGILLSLALRRLYET